MKKILTGILAILIVATLATSFWSKKEYEVPQAEFTALANMIKEKGIPTPNHPHESHRLEDGAFILTLTKEGKEIRKLIKNTYRSEIISPVTP